LDHDAQIRSIEILSEVF